MTEHLAPARLDDAALDELRRLEREMDTVLVALEPAPAYADLPADKLAKLRNAEAKLGVVMVAYDA